MNQAKPNPNPIPICTFLITKLQINQKTSPLIYQTANSSINPLPIVRTILLGPAPLRLLAVLRPRATGRLRVATGGLDLTTRGLHVAAGGLDVASGWGWLGVITAACAGGEGRASVVFGAGGVGWKGVGLGGGGGVGDDDGGGLAVAESDGCGFGDVGAGFGA